MHKKIKISITLLVIFVYFLFFQFSFSKYIIENTITVAKLNITKDRPKIELISISNSNTSYPNYANKTHLITVYMKINKKNIIKNNFSKDNIKILVDNTIINPSFKTFHLVSENTNEKTYEFSFTNITGDGILSIMIPDNVIEDKSGLKNQKKIFFTKINIDNTSPICTFEEIPSKSRTSIAKITFSEKTRPIFGWNTYNNYITKKFTNNITYKLPIMDLAQNSSNILIDIKKANNFFKSSINKIQF